MSISGEGMCFPPLDYALYNLGLRLIENWSHLIYFVLIF